MLLQILHHKSAAAYWHYSLDNVLNVGNLIYDTFTLLTSASAGSQKQMHKTKKEGHMKWKKACD